jgi:hypothetical protein
MLVDMLIHNLSSLASFLGIVASQVLSKEKVGATYTSDIGHVCKELASMCNPQEQTGTLLPCRFLLVFVVELRLSHSYPRWIPA